MERESLWELNRYYKKERSGMRTWLVNILCYLRQLEELSTPCIKTIQNNTSKEQKDRYEHSHF